MIDQLTPEIIAAAAEAFRAFEKKTRAPEAGGEDFYTLRDDVDGTEYGGPENGWIRQLVFDAHGKDSSGTPAMLPDDWRYAFVFSALAALSDAEEGEDVYQVRDYSCEPDVYTGDRLRWLASNLNRPSYCDEAREEFGTDPDDIVALIGWGQAREKEEVFDSVLSSLIERVESLAEDAEDGS